jgi:hypothetical protein
METQEITLAGKTYAVPLLPLGVIKKVYGALQRIAGKPLTEASLDELTGIVVIALKKIAPDITAEIFEDMHVTLDEIHKAVEVISIQCGLKKAASGEAKPGETQISTGTT